MIPPIASSLSLQVCREQTAGLVDYDIPSMVARVPEALSSDHDEASCCSGRATMPARVSFDAVRAVVRRKRVTFADEDEQEEGVTPDTHQYRSPTGAKRRRRRIVWNATKKQDTVDQPEQLRSNVSQSVSSCYSNHDVSGRYVVTSSSDDEDSLPTTSHTAALPVDPRQWTRSDVHIWLRQTTRSATLSNHSQQQQRPIDVDFERFRMNGKALCLMSSDMFAYRVPHGGHLLYKDFQARLCRAVAESLHRNCTVG